MNEPPKPGAIRRMAFFDSMPKELRQAVANIDVLPLNWMEICASGLRKELRLQTIINRLHDAGIRRAANNPAERELARAMLKDLGL